MGRQVFPWEVLERIIRHSGDEPQTLLSFSLTCRDLRPRALCLLVADVRFEGRVKIFGFCDFLTAHPHLKPFVRSVAVNPHDFAPFPLLDILPNLLEFQFHLWEVRHINFSDPRPPTVLNRSSLACCKHLGSHIRTLRLAGVLFPTYLAFAHLLLAFPNVAHLVCQNTTIKAEGSPAPLEVVKRHVAAQLQLLTLDIDLAKGANDSDDTPTVAALLINSGLVQSTVEALTVRYSYESRGLPYSLSLWPRLRSLVLKLSVLVKDTTNTIAFLQEFPPSMKDVMIEVNAQLESRFNDLVANVGLCEELERTLLRFPQPRIVFLVYMLRDGTHSFWRPELRRRFPVLFQRGAFTTKSRIVIPGAGHEGVVRDLAISPNGKWVVTASADSTIILWDPTNGCMAHKWIAHNFHGVTSLGFSPDGRYLVSGGGDSKGRIWDLAEGPREVTTLERHSKSDMRCAWSPRGDVIATESESDDGTVVQLWDARTFDQLHVLQHDHDASAIRLVAFSPDGHWLVSSSSFGYSIWNIASGTVHRSPQAWEVDSGTYFYQAAAFDPVCRTRLAIGLSSRVEIWDVETEEELAVLKTSGAEIHNVAFSPDGTLVVTALSDNVLKIWDAYAGVELFSLEGHEDIVHHARFSPCGKYVASGSRDGTVRLWRTRDGTCAVRCPKHKDSSVIRLAFSPNGETLWSGDCDGTVIMRCMRDIIPADE